MKFKSLVNFNLKLKPIGILCVTLLSALFLSSCGQSGDDAGSDKEGGSRNLMKEAEQMIDDGKGLGPVKNVTLSDTLDEQIAMQGFEIFKVKCAACHKFTNERFIGPGLMGVTKRRKPEWIMNMIMNPIEMAQKDPAAKELVSMYLVQMTDLNVSESESRSILEYFRKIDSASN